MAVDERMFLPQRPAFPDLEVPVWIPPRPRESLPHYAARLAATWRPDGPFYLGGVSFGGMVALEAARHVCPAGVFLIASARSGRVIRRATRLLERLTRPLPDAALELGRRPTTELMIWRNRLSRQHRSAFRAMTRAADLSFLRWAARAVLEWHFDGDADSLGCPIHQIHGTNDPLIPLVRGWPQRVIPGGAHLINYSHAQEVNEFLADGMRMTTGPRAPAGAAAS